MTDHIAFEAPAWLWCLACAALLVAGVALEPSRRTCSAFGKPLTGSTTMRLSRRLELTFSARLRKWTNVSRDSKTGTVARANRCSPNDSATMNRQHEQCPRWPLPRFLWYDVGCAA